MKEYLVIECWSVNDLQYQISQNSSIGYNYKLHQIINLSIITTETGWPQDRIHFVVIFERDKA